MSTPSPPSLYEKFLDGLTDIEAPGEKKPGSVSPPRSPITLANPLNKFHIPRVPASGIDVKPKEIPSTGKIANEVDIKGKGKATLIEPAGSMLQRESGTQPKMSQAARETLQKVRKMIPPMLETFHKGQMGRVAVIGGSEDYTGAPYFSAMASARLGADMSHVICEPQAAQVIKSYSPNLMVHPLMRQSSHASSTDTAPSIASAITALLPRFHVLVIGPGLGRDPLMHDVCARVIMSAKESHVPFVLDADGLLLAQTRPELVQGYRECILTPNLAEFARLCMAQGLDPLKFAPETGEGAEALARRLGGVTVVQKGRRDWISNGETTMVNDLEGGYKRSGGQGDTLTGSLATFLAWRKAYLDGIWEHDGSLDKWELLALAAFGGSAITRECSRLAFAMQGRSLQASDLTEEVAVAFRNLFEETTGADAKADARL